MSDLIPLGGAADLSMTSEEIADLVKSNHADVRRSIERLAERGVITLPPLAEVSNPGPGPKTIKVYLFSGERGKRDSIIVVAQLCPEFTARLVDRWQELETLAASSAIALPNFANPAEAARAWAEQYEARTVAEKTNVALEHKVSEQAPMVEALERFAEHEGKFNTRNAAKMLGVAEKKLIVWLLTHDWYYRDHGGRLCAKSAKIAAGYLDTVPVVIRRSDGDQTVPQPVVTQRGLARLGVLLAKDGLLPQGCMSLPPPTPPTLGFEVRP